MSLERERVPLPLDLLPPRATDFRPTRDRKSKKRKTGTADRGPSLPSQPGPNKNPERKGGRDERY